DAWGAERPGQPKAPVVPHPLEYSGEDSASKRARVGQSLAEVGAEAAVLTAHGSARLFLDPDKVTPDLPAWLGNQVSLDRPEALEGALKELRGKRVAVDPGTSSAW